MISRCTNPANKSFAYYGGAGITVCPEWQSLANFKQWALMTGYEPGLELDRFPDNTKGYSPDNCRWATHTANCQNQKSNINLTAFGETKCLSVWSRDPRCQVSYESLKHRIYRGWPPEKAISTPGRAFKKVLLTAYGETKCALDWWRDPRCCVKYTTLMHRLSKGWALETALTTPA